MEVSGYLCTLTSARLVSIESCQNIYVLTIIDILVHVIANKLKQIYKQSLFKQSDYK